MIKLKCIQYGSLFLICSMLLLTSIFVTFGLKIIQDFYNYDNIWVIIFYMNVCYPINIIVYLYKYSYKRLIDMFLDKKLLKKTFLPSMIFTIESIVLSWCFINVPVSIFIIGRTSSAFLNVPFYKYYIVKKIPNLYYFGLVFLIVAYVLLIINYLNFAKNTVTIISSIVLFFSGFSTTVYNMMIEKHLNDYENNKNKNNGFIELDQISVTSLTETNKQSINDYTKLEVEMFYQIITHFYGFVIMFPISLGLSWNLFQSGFVSNFLFVLAGICNQIYFLFKILVYGYKQIAGNQVASGLDLFRRVIINIGAYAFLKEYYNLEIIFANVCMIIGSFLFVLGQLEINYSNLLNCVCCKSKINATSTATRRKLQQKEEILLMDDIASISSFIEETI